MEHGVMIATVGGDGRTPNPAHREMCDAVAGRAGKNAVLAMCGAEFYARAENAHAIISTGGPRLHANINLRKGVIKPE